MKALTCLVIVFCAFYYVQNISVPGLDSINKIKNHAQNVLTGKNATSNSSKINKPSTTQKDNRFAPPSSKNDTTSIAKSKNQTDSNLKNATSSSSNKSASDPDQVALPKSGYFLPSSPEDLNISIIHFTNLNTKSQLLGFNDTQIDEYIRGRKPYFIIHGWRSQFSYESWLDEMKDTILKLNNGSANVFVVDCSETASSILYPISAANTKLIGKALGYFIVNTLVKRYDVKCENIHILGHSLGGQAAGFIGKYCKSKHCFLGRITGLDPAGPFFRTTDENERISEDDAFYVDIVHTNAAPVVLTGLGTTHQSGMVDFWINGGQTQTGCDLRDSIGNVIKDGIDLDAPSCSHTRAPQIYSVNFDKLTGCQLIGYQCESYKKFTAGECGDCGDDNNRCRLIGFSKTHDPTKVPPPKTNEKFYVVTTAETPYCQHNYQIKIKTSANLTSRAIGSFYLNIIGNKRDAKDIKIESPIAGLSDNQFYYFLLNKDQPLRELEKVEIYFNENVVGSLVGIASTVKVAVDEILINYMSNINPVIRKRYSGKFLPQSADKLISKTSKNRTVYYKSD